MDAPPAQIAAAKLGLFAGDFSGQNSTMTHALAPPRKRLRVGAAYASLHRPAFLFFFLFFQERSVAR
jgi:hypothetical protein